MKKILVLFIIMIMVSGNVFAGTLSEDKISFKQPIGTLFAVTVDGEGQYLTDGDNNVIAGPFEFVSDYSGYPYAKAFDGKKTLFDTDGSVIVCVEEEDDVSSPANGIYGITRTTDGRTEYVYYDYETREELFKTGERWFYYLEQQSEKMFIKKNGKWAVINNKGEYLTDFIYDDVIKKFNPDYEPYPKAYAVVVVDGKEKYIDWQLNEINLENYNGGRFVTQCYPIKRGTDNFGDYYVTESGDLFALYDNSKKQYLIDYQSEFSFREMNEDYIIVKKDELYGVADYDGNILVPVEYDDLSFGRDDDFLYYRKNSVTGYFDPVKMCEVSDISGIIVEPGIMLHVYTDYTEGYKKYCGEIINFAGHNLTGVIYPGVGYENGQFFASEHYTDNPDIPIEVDRSFAVVKLNGTYLPFDGCIRDSRTLVPMREIVEGLGGEVLWNGETMTATALIDGNEISMTVGDRSITVNGAAVITDVPPQLINEKTMLPVRVLCENIGASVDWDERIRCVYITK